MLAIVSSAVYIRMVAHPSDQGCCLLAAAHSGQAWCKTSTHQLQLASKADHQRLHGAGQRPCCISLRTFKAHMHRVPSKQQQQQRCQMQYPSVGNPRHIHVQVNKCRASIRDCVRLCEESEGERPIPPELFDEDGELDEEFIFCCRCTETDAPEVCSLLTCLLLHGCCCREC